MILGVNIYQIKMNDGGAADEELAGDQQREKAARSRRGVARISARGVPKSLGNKGVASWGVRDSAKSARACYNYSTFPGLLPPL